MTEQEIRKVLATKYGQRPSETPRARRKSKLKSRYGSSTTTLADEINRTNEKLALLLELFDALHRD